MNWYQDQSGRWYIAEQDGTTRWATPEEEAARARSMSAHYHQGPQSYIPAEQQAARYATGQEAYGAAYQPVGSSAQQRAKRSWGLPIGTGVAGLVIGVVLGAAGAGSGGSDSVTVTGGGETTASAAADSATAPGSGKAAQTPDPAAGKRDKNNPAFGATVAFKDKSTLMCANPVTFKRDKFAAGGARSTVFLKVQCTFKNRSGETFEPALTTLSMSAAGAEGESVFQEGLDAPDNPVLAGKSVTWWSGYGVQANKDVQLSVNVGFLDYPTITFS